ncbi:MAG: DUF3458 domain-containing protein, partial [Bosea sp. (in: a-proteobacteria)]
ITCRDWFQLCLKEGLTVFRDQEFSSDERSRPVKRIADVRTLRSTQFSEDAGPLAHPVRPQAYREINNFYTPTIYEKGAELIRMLKVLIGDEAFRAGMDLYFDRCDGTAATIEQFLACFAESSGQDLTHFAHWYEQAGTPTLVASGSYDAKARSYTLSLAQSTPPTPEQSEKRPVVIPVRLGLVGASGDMPLVTADSAHRGNGVVVLDQAAATITFNDVPSEPVPSLLRGFSAPVRLDMDLSSDALLSLFRADSDPFNRWQAAQTVSTRALMRASGRDGIASLDEPCRKLAATYQQFLSEVALAEPAFASQVLRAPGPADIAREIGHDVDPDAIQKAWHTLGKTLGAALTDDLLALRAKLPAEQVYNPQAASAGRRALRNEALMLLSLGDPARGQAEALAQYAKADNLTDRLASLHAALLVPGEAREEMIVRFGDQHANEPLVLDKWFLAQASIAEAGTLEHVTRLMTHRAFAMTNPNRVRSLIGGFAGNLTQFNRADGAGHDFVADMVIALDRTNPQIASRLLGAFKTWRMLEPVRRSTAEAALRRVSNTPGLSRDVSDIATRALA